MTTLIKYEAACRSLAEAHRIDEVKDIRDKAEAMRVYAIQAKNVDLEVMASEIRDRGERRLGELIIESKASGQIQEGRPKKNCSDGEQFPRVKLDDLGVDRKLSSRSQKLAGIAERAFEAMIARKRQQISERGNNVTLSAEEKKERRAVRERVLGGIQCALPEQKFGVILADPEWRFEPWSRETGMDRAADNHYPTSITSVIAERDVASIAADDCVLFLWATGPMIREALAVMEAWGFEYKSQVIWRKPSPITGYWFRSVHELLLVGTRGHIPAPAMGTQSASVIDAPSPGAHSSKLECFLEMIERYFPTLPKIELNRRGAARRGWEAWGNEASPVEPITAEVESAEAKAKAPAESVRQTMPPPTPSSELDIPASLRRGHPDCVVPSGGPIIPGP